MVGFHLACVLALAMVAYADAVDGGCRRAVALLGPVDGEVSGALRRRVALGPDAWADALRRWRQWCGHRSAVATDGDGSMPVARHLSPH